MTPTDPVSQARLRNGGAAGASESAGALGVTYGVASSSTSAATPSSAAIAMPAFGDGDAIAFLTAVAVRVEAGARADLENTSYHDVFSGDEASARSAADAALYAVEAGGKRLRPALVIAAATACLPGSPDPWAFLSSLPAPLPAGRTRVDAATAADILAVATAFEYIHTYSLIHDDLPVMDNDELRRGRASTHVARGVPDAVTAGALLMERAFALIRGTALPARHELARILRDAAGVRGMVGGQALDILGEHRTAVVPELVRIHSLKTAALIRGAIVAGAVAVNVSLARRAVIESVGDAAGLAFQIVDDLLDVLSTAQKMGKPVHVDSGKGKRTYPAVLGIEASRLRAAELIARAEDGLKKLSIEDTMLAALVRFVLRRDS